MSLMSCSRWRALVEDVAQHVLVIVADGPQLGIVHQFGKADNAVQRGAQFMRDARQKAALGFGGQARGFQGARQLLVLVAQFHGVLRDLARGHGGQVAFGHVQQGADHAGHFARGRRG